MWQIKNPEIRPATLDFEHEEATFLFQWDAPVRVLGEPPEVNIHREVILASSEGDSVEYLKIMQALMQRHYEDESNAICALY